MMDLEVIVIDMKSWYKCCWSDTLLQYSWYL